MLGKGKELALFADFGSWLQTIQWLLVDVVVAGTRCCLDGSGVLDKQQPLIVVVAMDCVAIILAFVLPMEPLLLLKSLLAPIF